MTNISIRALVLAVFAVLGIDILSGIVLAFTFGRFEADMSDAQLQAATAQMLADPGYLAAALILGTASTAIGGFLAARLGRIVPYYHGLAFGVVAVILSALTSGELPLWFRLVGLALTIPVALAGAHLAKLSAQKPS